MQPIQVAAIVREKGGLRRRCFHKGVQHHDVAEVHVDAGGCKFEHLFFEMLYNEKNEKRSLCP